MPSGVPGPFGKGPSVQPASSQIVGAKSMFWTRSVTARGVVPSPAGQEARNGICVT